MIDALFTDTGSAARLAHLVPVVLAGAALATSRILPTPAAAWRLARWAAFACAGLALGTLLLAWQEDGAASAQDAVLLLVTTIGAVITRFSATYLDGERGQRRFAGWLLATLAGATLVIATDHLLVLSIAWLATSLCLQNLLTFYGDRPIAQLAAHKKFLCSRAADLCLLGAVLLLAAGPGQLHLDRLAATVASSGMDSATAMATSLIAIAVLLKSAQLPFHGWLMQVMEAPTPVSALLHAGVVNLGGYVLIRIGSLLGAVPAAQTLLVLVGGLTAVLAALSASTRVSVKVALAWSTCAQMGFMLLQCGLGLYSMALLHLFGHSIYKAHAFLAASGAVQRTARARLAPRAGPSGALARIAAMALAFAVLFAIGTALDPHAVARPEVLAMMTVVALAAGSLTRRAAGANRITTLSAAIACAAAVAGAWFGLHVLLEAWLTEAGGAAPAATPPIALSWFVVAAFVTLAGVDLLRTEFADSKAAIAMQRWFQEGMHLDGWFTRLTLRIFGWRSRTPAKQREVLPVREADSI